MKRNILVLGPAGFIGMHLIEKLKKNENSQLTLIGNNAKNFSNLDKAKIFDGEINLEKLQCSDTPDWIFFIAGGSSVAASLKNPQEDFNRTVPAISNLLNHIKSNWPMARLIFISSAAVYGLSGCESTSISSPLKPISPYGLHKKLCEELILFHVKEHGLNCNILRPFSIYGPGLTKQLLWDTLNKAAKGNFQFFGTGTELRDWVHISDFVHLISDFENYRNLPTVVNVGSGLPIPTSVIIGQILREAGYPNRPNFIGQGKAGDPLHLVSAKDECSDIGKYLKTPLTSGLKSYVAWFKARGER